MTNQHGVGTTYLFPNNRALSDTGQLQGAMRRATCLERFRHWPCKNPCVFTHNFTFPGKNEAFPCLCAKVNDMPLITAKEKSARLEECDKRGANDARQSEPRHLPAEVAAAATSAVARFYDADGYRQAHARYFGLFGCLAVMFSLTGCADFTMTNPPRTATEQLLLSTAADRALKNASLEMFRGKKVFIDGTYFDSYDAKYVLGALRDTFSQAGALLAPAITNSDIIVEARSGAFSTDFSSSLIGIPNLGLPIPLVGVISIPELALYKSSDQRSLAKFALLAYESKSREHYYSSGPLVGNAYANIHKVLFFLWVTTDVPEKKNKKD